MKFKNPLNFSNFKKTLKCSPNNFHSLATQHQTKAITRDVSLCERKTHSTYCGGASKPHGIHTIASSMERREIERRESGRGEREKMCQAIKRIRISSVLHSFCSCRSSTHTPHAARTHAELGTSAKIL